MLLGVCRHCHATGQRFYDEDETRHTRIRECKCLSCGNIPFYLTRRGKKIRAGIPPTEAQRLQAEAEAWERMVAAC